MADAKPEAPLYMTPPRDVPPHPGEVVYVPGPVPPQPEPSAWQKASHRLKQEEARATPRDTMSEVALAKQALLDLAYTPAHPSRHGSLPRVKPLQAAVGAGLLILVVTYVPMTRTAFKVGLVFALRAAITRFVGRYV
jgi:hypothetical protein